MKKIITVDFDETLAIPVTTGWDGTSLAPIKRVLDFVKKQHNEGAELHVVSFRNWREKAEMEKFCKSHLIPIKSFTCTEGKTKTPFLKKLGSKLHIDDSVEVCVLAFMAGIECLLVDHGQDDTNEMAKLFPKL